MKRLSSVCFSMTLLIMILCLLCSCDSSHVKPVLATASQLDYLVIDKSGIERHQYPTDAETVAVLWNFNGVAMSLELPSEVEGLPVIGVTGMQSRPGVNLMKEESYYSGFGGTPRAITLPDGLLYIFNNSFWHCDNLKSISLPDSLININERAFLKCVSLESIVLPDSLTFIGEKAFKDCESLTSIVIPGGVTAIMSNTFQGCKGLNSVTISEGVTEIDSFAFHKCMELQTVTMPKSVEKIEICAFDNCERLSDVYYAGTQEQWNAIEIEKHNEFLIYATIHYNQ